MPNISRDLRKILKKIENNVFCGSVKAYDVFK